MAIKKKRGDIKPVYTHLMEIEFELIYRKQISFLIF